MKKDSDLELVEIDKSEHENKSPDELTEAMIWRIRLGHVSVGYLRRLKDTDGYFDSIRFEGDIRSCETCIMAKMAKKPFKEEMTRASKPLYRTHTDI